MKADWNKIRREYVTTDISYRDLAAKYEICPQLIYRRGKEEKWVEKRKAHISKVDAKVEQKSEEKKVDQAVRICEAADKVIDKIFQLLELEDALAPRDLKSLSSTLMDLRMLRNLGKEDEAVADDNTIKVTFVNNEWDGDPDA